MSNEQENILNANMLLLHSQMPRIGKALELFWGEKEFRPFVNNLMTTGRADRQGFPRDVLTAILTLQALHDKMFPEFIPPEIDNWKSSQFGIL